MVEVRQLAEGESLRRFIRVAWRANARDPNWVPPLLVAQKTLLDRRKHPFHQHADVAYFLAEREGEAIGRIAAIINHRHNEFHQEKLGFFGFFEADEDEEASGALFDAAAQWLRERGMERMRGPANFSSNEEWGLLIEGFDTPPMIMMPHNPPYYAHLHEAAGLEKTKDLLAYWLQGEPPEQLVRTSERIARRDGITVRGVDLRRFRSEVDIIKEVYNSAWARNWGFVPMSDAEFEHMAKELRPVVDPNLCLIAERKGEPVGFSLALPDLNRALKHLPNGRLFPFGIFRLLREKRRIRAVRLITLGVKPDFQHVGLGMLLYLRTWQVGNERGYFSGEASWVLEDNWQMRKPLEKMGARIYKRYRLYERAL